MKKLVIGIDVSKEKLDLCLQSGGRVVSEWTLSNSIAAIRSSLKEVLKRHGAMASELLICAEYTGQYTYPLCCACAELSVDLWLENPAQLNHFSGIQRGKNDRLDARRIVAYAVRFQDRARLFSLSAKNIATLKQLVSERDMYMCDKSKYGGLLTDQQRFMDEQDYAEKSDRIKPFLKTLEAVIAEIDAKIQALIDNDAELKRQHELLLSSARISQETGC
jgi:transposase